MKPKKTASPHNAPDPTGIISASFGRHYEICPDDPVITGGIERLKCVPRGKKSVYACGDAVRFAPGGDGHQGVITERLPRRNLLWRSDAFRQKLIAANLSQVIIVVATEPGFSPLLISRCITATESEGIGAMIVLNKADITDQLPAARKLLEPFSQLGYRIVEISATGNADTLRPHLAGQQSIFVGQSGMGKSTLTNALIPEARAATAEISAALDAGKHTTTFARLYTLPEDGWLIDSPGLQVFGLAHIAEETLAQSFVEFRNHIGQCRFRDCRHLAEPGCALRAAVASGDINPQRFEHFLQIRDEIQYATRQARGY